MSIITFPTDNLLKKLLALPDVSEGFQSLSNIPIEKSNLDREDWNEVAHQFR